jgi:hypothetical protein
MGRILLENLRLVDESLIYVVVLSDNISLEDVLVGLFLGNELVGLVAAGQVVDLGEDRAPCLRIVAILSTVAPLVSQDYVVRHDSKADLIMECVRSFEQAKGLV